jgi:hypothetical protein
VLWLDSTIGGRWFAVIEDIFPDRNHFTPTRRRSGLLCLPCLTASAKKFSDALFFLPELESHPNRTTQYPTSKSIKLYRTSSASNQDIVPPPEARSARGVRGAILVPNVCTYIMKQHSIDTRRTNGG